MKSKLPDLDVSPIMWVEMDNGIGGIHASTIMTILPDMSSPKTQSLLITTVFVDGLSVKGNSVDLIKQWYSEIADVDEEEDEDDDEDNYDEFGDRIIVYCEPEEGSTPLSLVPKDD